MARAKQTKRKTLAKKKSGPDKRRSPRIAAQNELKDYDDEPAPEAEDTTHVQTGAKTRRDTMLERQDDAANAAAEATQPTLAVSHSGWGRLLTGSVRKGGAMGVWLGRRRRSRARKGAEALPCDPFKSQGYDKYEEGDDHPPCVEQAYRKAGFDWDHAASRAMIDKLAVVCQTIDHSVPVPNNNYLLIHWVEWLLENAEKLTAARRVKIRGAAKEVARLAIDSYESMSAIAAEQGSLGFCESCAMDAATLLDNHPEIDDIEIRGLVVTRDGGCLCGNQKIIISRNQRSRAPRHRADVALMA